MSIHSRIAAPGRRASGALLLGAALLTALGCGESRIETAPVSGKITFDGQPPIGAQIVLHPVDRSKPSEVAPSGQVKADGVFTISSYEAGDGAPPGEYVATVQWYKLDKDLGGPGPNVIPKEYSSEKTSPLKVKVESTPTTLPPIVIKSNGAAKG